MLKHFAFCTLLLTRPAFGIDLSLACNRVEVLEKLDSPAYDLPNNPSTIRTNKLDMDFLAISGPEIRLKDRVFVIPSSKALRRVYADVRESARGNPAWASIAVSKSLQIELGRLYAVFKNDPAQLRRIRNTMTEQFIADVVETFAVAKEDFLLPNTTTLSERVVLLPNGQRMSLNEQEIEVFFNTWMKPYQAHFVFADTYSENP